MRDVIPQRWLDFTEPMEGGIPWPYNDIYGYTTIAYGNLVNSVGAVLGLPFMRKDGTPATAAEIASAWQAVHNDPQAARQGHLYAKGLTTIRLTRDGMRDLALKKLASNNVELVALLPDFEDWPACAQLAMHSWAWACGAHSPFPKLFSALRARDFDAASVYIHINEDGPDRTPHTADDNRGLIPRNIRNKILMRNAARVQGFHLDPDLLDWENDISISAAPTVPALPDDAEIVHVDPALYDLGTEPPDSEPAA